MTPEHIEFYQVDKEQAGKITLKPAQRRRHAIFIRFGMISLRQTSASKEIFDLADTNDVFAILL